MHLGIKVGPDNWRDKLLDGLSVRHVEIYHNFKLEGRYAYAPLYAWLRENGVAARLHASTPLPGGVSVTLGTSDAAVREASIAMHKRTIDAAAEHGLDGVVVHSGSYRVPRLRGSRVEVIGPDTTAEEGRRWLRASLEELAAYGRARGVEPLIENMPGREFAGYHPMDRSDGVDVRFASYQTLCELGEAGFSLCVDLAHLYTELMVNGRKGAGMNGLHARVREAAEALAPYARHAHLSTVTPPWNGTDGHSGFLESDYARSAIPGREALLALLELFAGRDVWLIPEPMGGAEVHLANVRRLGEWLEEWSPLSPPRKAHGGEEAGALSGASDSFPCPVILPGEGQGGGR
jgi:sugar phosphate isomerase/epimerase